MLSKEFLYCFNSVDKVKEVKCSLIEWKSIDSGFDRTQKSFFDFFSIYEKDKACTAVQALLIIFQLKYLHVCQQALRSFYPEAYREWDRI